MKKGTKGKRKRADLLRRTAALVLAVCMTMLMLSFRSVPVQAKDSLTGSADGSLQITAVADDSSYEDGDRIDICVSYEVKKDLDAGKTLSVTISNFPLEKCCNSRWFLAQQVIF